MKKIITFLILILLSGGVSGAEKPRYESTIDYIQKTGRLWGVAEVRRHSDNSVTLVDANSGYGQALMMSLVKVVNSVTIKAGESCTLSDGHHVFITYKLKRSEKGKITFLWQTYLMQEVSVMA